MLQLVPTRLEPSEHIAGNCDFSAIGGEHPLVTLRKVGARPRPPGQIIVFANEKGGVGKSTLAFHSAIALCDAGARVASIDLDLGQQSLSQCIENRKRTARCLDVNLPTPSHVALNQQNGAQLSQEIARIGSDCDFVVVDLAGHDSPVARYAIALADTLVTPVNSSSIDLDLLGKFDPVSGKLKDSGRFSKLVSALNEARLEQGIARADWIVAKNRVRSAEKKQQIRIDNALRQIAAYTGFRVSEGLSERVVYRELLPFGLTHFDLKRIPGLAKMQGKAQDEVSRFVLDLNLRPINSLDRTRRPNHRAKMCHDLAESYATSLYTHLHPRPR
jgi:chromosome partitioning protein